MEENKQLLESLVERATNYGKTCFELVKLRTVDKTSDVVSSVIPYAFVLILAASFTIFLNFGLAIWLGELTGKLYYGFFIIAAFYVLAGIIAHFFMHKPLKKNIRNFVIKKLLE